MNVYLASYNNYYNRIYKPKLPRIQDYRDHILTSILNVTMFNYGDGVNAEFVANFTAISAARPDYAILQDNDGFSVWFIIEEEYLRNAQYRFTLKRDVLAESWEYVRSSPMMIDRATLSEDDPLIYNAERPTFNQIKRKETLIKGKTGVPWIVGYVASGHEIEDVTFDATLPTIPDFPGTGALSGWEFYQYTNQAITPTYISDANKTIITTLIRDIKGNKDDHSYSWREVLDFAKPYMNDYRISKLWDHITPASYIPSEEYTLNGKWNGPKWTSKWISQVGARGQYYELLRAAIPNVEFVDENLRARIDSEVGKIYHDTASGKYYLVSVGESTAGQWHMPDNSPVKDKLVDILESSGAWSKITRYDCTGSADYPRSLIMLIPININDVTIPFPGTRRTLLDQPYDMFCMPYGKLKIGGSTQDFTSISFQAAMAISAEGSGASPWLYDLQILPYCPFEGNSNIVTADGEISLTNMTEDTDYVKLTDSSDNTVGYMFFPAFSQFSFRKPMTFTERENRKLSTMCDLYRLVSPDGATIYEWSPAMNDYAGGVDVNCTYKPYSPFIQVLPIFAGGMYGGRYNNDQRGLICRGDFTLPQISDSFAAYERQNINYQKIFDRQIKTNDTKFWINQVGKTSSAITGAGTNLGMGLATGNVGQIAGAAMGLESATIGAATSIATHYVERSAQIDIHKMQLENIAATPDGLSGIGTITQAFKLFPFVEYYTCTRSEVEAAKDYIRYNGMACGRPGTIDEFLGNQWDDDPYIYVEGSLLRYEEPGVDPHYISELNTTLQKGVYIPYGTE